MSPVKFAAVVAVTKEWGIGRDALLPWHPKRLHLDIAFLKHITTHDYQLDEGGEVRLREPQGKNAIVMGRKTWDSIPARFRPMEGRYNIVITSKPQEFRDKCCGATASGDVYVAGSFDEAIEQGVHLVTQSGGRVYVLGGSAVYTAALADDRCEAVFNTRLMEHAEMPCNVFFPGNLLQTRFRPACNISRKVLDLLSPSLPKGAAVKLDEAGQTVREQEISYKIEVWRPK